MKLLNKQVYRFDGVEVDPAQGCLRRNGVELPIRQKSIQALLFLLEQRHRLVTKEELIERVWEGTAVSDDALVQLIKEIRQNLGDDPRQPRFIKTVPKAGYRFIASVDELHLALPATIEIERHSSIEIEYEEEITEETVGHEDGERGTSPHRRLSASPRPRISLSPRQRVLIVAVLAILLLGGALTTFLLMRSSRRSTLADVTLPVSPGKKPLAVMYFDNQSGSPDLEWLREGLADMLIANLSRSKQLNVLSRQQLFMLLERIGHRPADPIRLDDALEIGRKSKAEVIALGSFARLGDKIRINVSLYNTSNGQQTAVESIVADRPADILTQVDLLSFKLSNQLGTSIGGEADKTSLNGVMTRNLEAYRYYSLGIEMAQALRNEEALALLHEAVALDPRFAMAHARIGYVYGVTGNDPGKAKPYLEKAFQHTDRLTEKDRLNITAWYAIVNFDYAAAIEAFRRIITSDPLQIDAYRRLSLLLKGEEKHEEAITVLKQGLVIDSGARDLYNALGGAYSDLGRHDEAIAMFQRYVQLAPNEPNSHDSLGLGYQWAGRYDEAIQEYQLALQLKPDFEIAVVHLGNVYFQQGRYRAAMEQFQRYLSVAPTDGERMRAYSSMAYVEFRRGNIEKAERTARTAYRYGKLAVGIYLVGLQRNDLATVRKLRDEMERTQRLERGTRGSSRPIWHFRGLLALKSGSHEEAIADFRQAIGQRPRTWDLDALEDCLANGYLELGRFDEAIKEYQRILKLNPNYPLVHYHLAQAHERKGQADLARSEYEQFLQVWKEADADLPEVITARKRLVQ